MKASPVLFLDFDGVTHPEQCTSDKLFTCLPLIENVLRRYEDVEVVISSSWREFHKLSEMRGFFASDIAQRVVDCTPILPRNEVEPAPTRVRQRECLTWLDANRPGRPWLAIDDVPWMFEVGCANLLLTNHLTGFSQADAIYLKSVLERFK